VLEELIEMFTEKNGRPPTEDEVGMWAQQIRDLNPLEGPDGDEESDESDEESGESGKSDDVGLEDDDESEDEDA
jgi:hypothetical protein